MEACPIQFEFSGELKKRLSNLLYVQNSLVFESVGYKYGIATNDVKTNCLKSSSKKISNE